MAWAHPQTNPRISHAAVLAAFDYDKETGFFKRKVRLGTHKPGTIAGGKMNTGYLAISFMNSQILAHRLAWFYVHGEWPINTIDHINGNRQDNRIANLRDVSIKINTRNIVAPSRNNASGFLGVHFRPGLKKPWRSGYSYDRRYKHLGYFETPEEAHLVYLKARESEQQREPVKGAM